MEYVQPYGEADPNASYHDRNSGAGQPGSRVPAKAIEHPLREIMAVITGAGLTPDGSDLTQLAQAIAAMIASATGGADTSTYLLMATARARLPIYPEIVSADGTFNLAIPATGTVRIPAGIEIIHRGVFSVTTVQQDFVTSANKVYHLRWNPTTGFALKDAADVGYNPSALAESNAGFDTKYDDMITHRVVTNASNVATVTNLVNRASVEGVFNMAGTVVSGSAGGNNVQYRFAASLNWARTPNVLPSLVKQSNSGYATDADVYEVSSTITRYAYSADWLVDYAEEAALRIFARAKG